MDHEPRSRVGGAFHLLTTGEVARLLRVSPRTVNNWITQEKIPYLELSGGEYRVPLTGLLASLGGTFDLGQALRELEFSVDDHAARRESGRAWTGFAPLKVDHDVVPARATPID